MSDFRRFLRDTYSLRNAAVSTGESLKKAALDSPRGKKKKVQWVYLMGKELVEIREFESSEEDDIRYDGDQSCVCVIL